MSEQLHQLIAFDVSRKAYLSIIRDAAEGTDWKVLPYDDETYAIEDLGTYPRLALVTALYEFGYAYADFEGKALIEKATSTGTPHAVIADENMRSRLSITEPNLFIPRKPGMVVEPLSSWLISLSTNV